MGGCSGRLESLSSLLDGELGGAEELELRRHLDGCPRCAAWWDELQLLSSGLSRLYARPRAPRTLHTRVGRLASDRSAVRIAIAAGAAAALFGVLFTLLATRETDSLAPALVGDHHRLVSGEIALAVPSSDPDEVAHGLAARLPFRVAVASVPGARLRGGHACSLPGQRAAYLQYEQASERISVFVYPGGGRESGPRCREVEGESLCTFSGAGGTVAVVAASRATARAFGSAARVVPGS